MVDAKLIIVFGSKTYGSKTASKCSTYHEINFIMDDHKPFFLVKMCKQFDLASTRVLLNRDIAYQNWYAQDKPDIPCGLVDAILTKLETIRNPTPHGDATLNPATTPALPSEATGLHLEPTKNPTLPQVL